MSDSTLTHPGTGRAPGRIAVLWPMIFATVLGIGVLYVVGFAGTQSIHDAAHDTRHSLNFPCH